MQRRPENWHEIGTERIRLLVEFVCSVYGLSHAELADALGKNRGWFTRYLNGSIADWGAMTLFGLVEMCAAIDGKMLLDWLTVEDSTSN